MMDIYLLIAVSMDALKLHQEVSESLTLQTHDITLSLSLRLPPRVVQPLSSLVMDKKSLHCLFKSNLQIDTIINWKVL